MINTSFFNNTSSFISGAFGIFEARNTTINNALYVNNTAFSGKITDKKNQGGGVARMMVI